LIQGNIETELASAFLLADNQPPVVIKTRRIGSFLKQGLGAGRVWGMK